MRGYETLVATARAHGSRLRIVGWGLLWAALAWAAAPVSAHNLGESYLYLQVYPEELTGRFEIALSDLNRAMGWTGSDEAIVADNLDQRIGYLEDYYLEHVQISGEQGPLEIRYTGYNFLGAHDGYVQLSFDLEGYTEVPKVLDIDYSVLFEQEPRHRGFLLIEHNWATGTFANENQISLIFQPDSQSQSFDLQSSGRLQGFMAMVELGAEHMWLGLDHVMFVIALLMQAVLYRDERGVWQPSERWAPAFLNVVKIVVAFTVAHSITLALAAFDIFQLPGRLVEVIIALSIGVVAANILFPLIRIKLWWVVFGFGLFHGFGFAGALSDLGAFSGNMGLSRLAFNLGVEWGQLVLVAVLFPVLFLLGRLEVYRRIVMPAAAVVMILFSCVWTIERAFGLDFHLTRRAKSLVRKVF